MAPNQPNSNQGPSLDPAVLAALARGSRQLSQDLDYARENLRDMVSELNGLPDKFRKTSSESAKLNGFIGDSLALTKDLAALYSEEVDLQKDLVVKQVMLNTGLKNNYAQLAATAVLEGKNLEDVKAELLARQAIADKLKHELELTESLAEWQLEMREELEGYSMGWEKLKSKLKAIATDPKLAKTIFMVEGAKTLIESVKKFGEGFEKLREKGLSAGQAAEGQIKSISALSVLGLSDTAGVLDGMVETYGNINALTSKQIDHMGHLAHEMGISGAEAFKLQAALSEMPGETLQTAEHAMEYTKHLAEANGLAPGKITGDMAKNTQAMALFSKNGAKGFAEAAVNLHKMGVEIGTASAMASKLLDFESSINAQMEASVLLGREINLDKARELALSGNLEGATKEILKNIGGQAEFDKMNVLQKQKLAEASGMTVEQLQKAIDAQQEYNKYHGEQAGIGMNILGTTTEWGGKTVGFLKEHGMLIVSTLSMLKQYGGMLNIIKSGWSGITGITKGGVGFIKNMFGKSAGGGVAPPVPEGSDKSTGGLTKSIEKINPGKLLAGAAALVLVAAAVYVFAKAAQEFTNVSWESIGKAIVGMLALVGALYLMGTFLAGPQAVYLLAGAAAMLIIAAAVYVLGKAIQEMAKGFDLFVPSLLKLAPMAMEILVLGEGMVLLGAGMLALGYASFIAFPGLMLSSMALTAMLPSLLVINRIAQAGAFKLMGEGLLMMSAAGPGLGLVALSMMGIGTGLSMVALAGLAAMPVIGALVGLAVVAPKLAQLGNSLFGGGSNNSENKKNDRVVEAINTLGAKFDKLAAQPVVVSIDGSVIAKVVRQNSNLSKVGTGTK